MVDANTTEDSGSVHAEGSNPTRVWDLPLRLFHWALVILVSVSLYTGINGGFKEMDYHMLSGYSILALVLFRITWGFFGSENSRFTSFVKVSALVPYARQLFKRQSAKTTGHNPMGALSVIAILLALMTQATTGLFANDDIFMEGPLAHLVDDAVSDQLTTVHHFCAKVIYVLIGLHLTAIAFYELYRRDRLVLPMITGHKKGLSADAGKPSLWQEFITATLLMTLCGGFVYWLINYL